MKPKDDLPWPKCNHTAPKEKEPGSFYKTQEGYFVPEAEARELWEMKKENARLREALEIYADEKNWSKVHDDWTYTGNAKGNGYKFEDWVTYGEYDESPWLIAKKALEGGE